MEHPRKNCGRWLLVAASALTAGVGLGACSPELESGTESPRPAPEYISYSDLTADVCLDTCPRARDGHCDEPFICGVGTDCSDCGGTPTKESVGPDECIDSCRYANDEVCDVPYQCDPGTDCSDCDGRGVQCDNSCEFAFDGECDAPKWCDVGTDCSDCEGPADLSQRVVVVVVEDTDCDGASLFVNGLEVGPVRAVEHDGGTACSDYSALERSADFLLSGDESAQIELRDACEQYSFVQEPIDAGTCAVVCLGCQE